MRGGEFNRFNVLVDHSKGATWMFSSMGAGFACEVDHPDGTEWSSWQQLEGFFININITAVA